MQPIQQDLKQSEINCLFAEQVVIASMVNANKDKKGKVQKEGIIKLVFMDVFARKPVAEIALTNLAANNLYAILGTHLEKQNQEIKSNKLPKKKQDVSKPKDYMG